MQAYVDYEYYRDTYLGNAIPEGDFPRLSLRASMWLRRMLGNNINLESESVKMACCAVAEAWQVNEQGGDLASQSVGGWSRTYSKKPKSDEQRLIEAARIYLPNLSPVVWA